MPRLVVFGPRIPTLSWFCLFWIYEFSDMPLGHVATLQLPLPCGLEVPTRPADY